MTKSEVIGMSEMFCDEPIIACYKGSREYDDIDGDNAWFDIFHDIAYHVTEGHNIRFFICTFFFFCNYKANFKTLG